MVVKTEHGVDESSSKLRLYFVVCATCYLYNCVILINSRLIESNTALTSQATSSTLIESTAQSDTVAQKMALARLQSEVDSVSAHAIFLEQELAAKHKDYQHLQQDSRDRAIQWQLQLDQRSDQLAAAEAQLSLQRRLEQGMQDKLNLFTRDNLDLKLQLQESTETSAAELQEERRQVALQKEKLAWWQQQYDDIVKTQEAMQKTAAVALTTGDAEWERARQELVVQYETVVSDQAAAYEAKIRRMQQDHQHNQFAHAPSPGRLLTASPTPALGEQKHSDDEKMDNDNDEGPLGMTDLYQKLEESKSTLREERVQRKSAERRLGRIQQEIARKTPELIRQRQEFDFNRMQLQDYQERLKAALSDRDTAFADRRETMVQLANMEQQHRSGQLECQDLARQVQTLLQARASSRSSDQVMASDLELLDVMNNLPTSIVEMQQHNQRLLSEHRRLTEQVTSLEVQLQTDELRAQLNQSVQDVEAMQKERHAQKDLVNKLVEQNQLYRKLLHKQDSAALGGEDSAAAASDDVSALTFAKQQSEKVKALQGKILELEGSLQAIQNESDRAGRDAESATERLARFEAVHKELMDRNHQLERELLSTRGNAARGEAEAAYHKKKCEDLDELLERARNEKMQTNEARAALQNINVDLQQTVSSIQAERVTWQGEARSAHSRVRMIEAQLNTMKASETRLLQENQHLHAEISNQGALIESIRRIETNVLAQDSGEKVSLRHELIAVSKLLADAEAKCSTLSDNASSKTAELEMQVEVLKGNEIKFQSEAVQSKEALSKAHDELQTLQGNYKKLEMQLRAAKRKLGLTNDADGEDIEVVMQTRIDALECDLEKARGEIASFQEQTVKYREMAQTSEATLKEVQETTLSFQIEQESKQKTVEQMLEISQKNKADCLETIRKLTNDLVGQRGEKDASEQQLLAQIATLQSEVEDQEKSSTSARAQAAALTHDIDTYRRDYSTAQNNYERELRLHADARTELRKAQESSDNTAHRLKLVEEQLETARKEFTQQSEALTAEKTVLDVSYQQIEQSLQGSREQNKLLHSQLESLNRMVAKDQSSRITAAAGMESEVALTTGSDSEHVKAISELREIVRILRSENEFLQTQLDTARRSVDREKSVCNILRRSLDEAREEIQATQSRGVTATEISDADAQAAMEKVQASVDDIKILKDSNKLLREENEKALSRLSTVEIELVSVKTAAEPTEKTLRELTLKITSLEAEKDSLEREVAAWKERLTSIVSNFNQIDPEVHLQLQNQVIALTAASVTNSELKNATEEELTRMQALAQSLQEKNSEREKIVGHQASEIAQLKSDNARLARSSSTNAVRQSDLDELNKRIARMETEAASGKTELEGTNKRNDLLRGKLREFQTVIKDLRTSNASLTNDLKESQNELADARKKVSEARKKVSEAQKVAIVAIAPHEIAVPTNAEALDGSISMEASINVDNAMAAPDSKQSLKFKQPPVYQSSMTVANESMDDPSKNLFDDSDIPKLPQTGFIFGPSKGVGPAKVLHSDASSLRHTAAPFIQAAIQHRSEQSESPAKSAFVNDTHANTNIVSQTASSDARGETVEAKPAPIEGQNAGNRKVVTLLNVQGSGDHTPSTSDAKERDLKKRLQEKIKRVENLKRKQAEAVSGKQSGEAIGKKAKNQEALSNKSSASIVLDSLDAKAEVHTSAAIYEATEADNESQRIVNIPESHRLGEIPSETINDAATNSLADTSTDGAANLKESCGSDGVVEDAFVQTQGYPSEIVPGLWNASGTPSSQLNPVGGSAVKMPFGSSTGTANLTTFGQSSTLASPFAALPGSSQGIGSMSAPIFGATNVPIFGASSTIFGQALSHTALSTTTHESGQGTANTSVTPFGSAAFLDIKPPSSSNSGEPVPTFTFGSSGTYITLPTPSLPIPSGPAAMPFGAFGTTSSFGGGFGAAPPASMQARPLFGEIVASEVNGLTDDAEVEMQDDDEGNMDA